MLASVLAVKDFFASGRFLRGASRELVLPLVPVLRINTRLC